MLKCTPRQAIPWLILLVFLAVGCSREDPADPEGGDIVETDLEIPDWAETTHGNSTEPDHDTVFAEDIVQRLDIVLDEDDWQDMLEDMTDKYGSFGGGGGGHPKATDDNPIWVAGSVFYEDTEWYKVGVRFKGNSSLMSAWRSGIMKLPLKLDFDQYEDTYPQLENQRFHGFKQLSLSSGYQDESTIREKVTADIFRDAGVVAARTAFYRIYIDHGDGPFYFGLYTMVEVVDDTVIETQYDDDNGNLYKPDGTGASFQEGTFDLDTFEKKNNEDLADWSDISALFDALHAGTRTTDPASWRTSLETCLDVEAFLNWLAVNTVIQNWDTYGKMTHNYYLYNNPATGTLEWIPWDNNEALQEGKAGGALPLDFEGVGSDWPLIRYLYDDPVYQARFVELVDDVASEVFTAERMVPIYQAASNLVQPYVVGVDGEQAGYTFLSSSGAFTVALADLVDHVGDRESAAHDYVTDMEVR